MIRPVRPDTIARSLAIGNPADGPYVLDAVRRTGGAVAHVSDAEVVEGIRLLAATEGVFAETAGGVTVATTRKLVESGRLDPDAETVLLITGDGLKTLDAVSDQVGPTATVPSTTKAVREALRAAGRAGPSRGRRARDPGGRWQARAWRHWVRLPGSAARDARHVRDAAAGVTAARGAAAAAAGRRPSRAGRPHPAGGDAAPARPSAAPANDTAKSAGLRSPLGDGVAEHDDRDRAGQHPEHRAEQVRAPAAPWPRPPRSSAPRTAPWGAGAARPSPAARCDPAAPAPRRTPAGARGGRRAARRPTAPARRRPARRAPCR